MRGKGREGLKPSRPLTRSKILKKISRNISIKRAIKGATKRSYKSKKNEKNFQEPLDKLRPLWYNNYNKTEEGERSNEERANDEEPDASTA